MITPQIYIIFAIIALLVITIILVLSNKNKKNKKDKSFTPLAGLAFAFVLGGIFFGEKRLICYSLIGIGVILAIIDMIRKLKRK
jgi:amino acid transporter